MAAVQGAFLKSTYFGKQFESSSKNWLPYDPAILLLSMYPRKIKAHIHIKIIHRYLW